MLELWLPTDRQRIPQPATPPTVAQVRRRLQRARLITENARNETGRRMADRLVATWQPDDMVAQALEDLRSSSSFLREEAQRFLEICAPDKLPTPGEENDMSHEEMLQENGKLIEKIAELTRQQAAMEGLRAKRSLQFDPDAAAALAIELGEAKAAQARVRRLLDIQRADQAAVEQRQRIAQEKALRVQAEQAVDAYRFAMSVAIDAACSAMEAITQHKRLVGQINQAQAKIGAGPLELPSPQIPTVDLTAAFALPDPRQAALKQLGGVPQTPARRPRPQPPTVAQQPAPVAMAFEG